MDYSNFSLTDWQEGQLLLIDKPKDWTSFDVVNKIRYTLKKHLSIKKLKVGHAGTLDPLATGLLLIAIGRQTKQIQHLQGLGKLYTGALAIGGTTPSADLETEIQYHKPFEGSISELNTMTQELTGFVMQRPPLFSARKLDGKRAYILAREGSDKELPSKEVNVQRFELLEEVSSKRPGLREFKFIVECSKGTYIRSLARDLGQIAHCGGFLTDLRRESIGEYSIEHALKLDDWLSHFS